MKRLLITMMLLSSFALAQAQNDLIINIDDAQDSYELCVDHYDRIVAYPEEGCNSFYWRINGGSYNYDTPLIIVIADYLSQHPYGMSFSYYGCDISYKRVDFEFFHSVLPNDTTMVVWKRQNETIQLEIPVQALNYEWSTGWSGPAANSIDPTETGTYTCSFSDYCGTAVWTYIVRDNVELYRATTNLRSNLNEVTWKTSEEQADYISSVKIFRNNQLIATAPYADGIFTDNIGSESTQWQYHLQAVDNDGNDCPIPSYWKRTIHLDHVQGTQGNEILQWTPYQQEGGNETVSGYGIYDVVGGEPRLIITVGDFTNVFAYNPADFDGYGTVAAVFSRDGEDDLAFSNLTGEVLDVNEQNGESIAIYPNPATNGQININGTGKLTISNTLGQTVKEMNVNGMASIELTSGIYFIQFGNECRKLIVQ